ncbi:hypothetical protein HMPREF0591_2982 [Mycobacterium parascrofulaceum ATCC BAA-614]|uniref:Uncharacterized protein n=1 Tax=Mycobacterium parascrofulaceum ATCC BAA-614 TaxID=525368 RepID=D5P9Y8_9MYCO|nr:MULTISPECIES: hypothetical protein [Mycobacterium]EFG77114.1 hypothetical protein HMPREF0591_2982 [Mycobacterium parascrofulaceum ATCC BAA-614]OCB63738.1 hypothetical protein A9X02_04570 [Mycobacterium malmoense]
MKLSESAGYWREIGIHTHHRLSLGSPRSVQLQVAALVGDHSIVASWSAYTSSGPSRWAVVAVTDDGRLIHVEMEFDVAEYDRDAEAQLHRQRQQVTVVVHDASARRLSEAVSLSFGGVSQRFDRFDRPSRDQVDVSDVRLRFPDGSEIDLGIDQSSIHDSDDRARSDELIQAIRSHAGL